MSGQSSKMTRPARSFRRLLKVFAGSEDGATAIEYGLILALIFLAIVGAVRGYVDSTSVMYSEIVSAIEN